MDVIVPDDFEAFHDMPVGKIRKDIKTKRGERQIVKPDLCVDITEVLLAWEKYTFPFDYYR